MYDVMSERAEDFIDNNEILQSLEFAENNKNNRELIEVLIEKAALCKGLTHREALILLECDIADFNEKMFELAKKVKEKFYGNRIVMFAPLYLSN